MKQTLVNLIAILILITGTSLHAKDYRNKEVGDYSNATVDLSVDRSDVSFLTYMKSTFYDIIKAEAPNQTDWRTVPYLEDIKNGIGAELRLAPDVTTYHVKFAGPDYEKAELSGRSFGVVHTDVIEPGTVVDYIADASYFFYLSELEKLLEDKKQAKLFYTAIFTFLINSDSSPFLNPAMEKQTKKVAADFIAVYVAEQYRRLLHYDGEKLTSYRAWDEAHLQTTILGSFHAGQSKKNKGMIFAGQFMNEVYVQQDRQGTWKDESDDICAYGILSNRDDSDDHLVEKAEKKDFQLSDYWQFGTNDNCGKRSGVNVTRKDFKALGYEITQWLNDNGHKETLGQLWGLSEREIGTYTNFVDSFSRTMSNDEAPIKYTDPQGLVDAMVEAVMLMRAEANNITKERLNKLK